MHRSLATAARHLPNLPQSAQRRDQSRKLAFYPTFSSTLIRIFFLQQGQQNNSSGAAAGPSTSSPSTSSSSSSSSSTGGQSWLASATQSGPRLISSFIGYKVELSFNLMNGVFTKLILFYYFLGL